MLALKSDLFNFFELKEGSRPQLHLRAVRAQIQILMRFVAMRKHCFRTYFFQAGAGIEQSTISEGYDRTVRTVQTCREWIIHTAYTSILGWDEAHLEIATSAPWVWMHACQMIHQTRGKRFVSKSKVTDLQLSHWRSNLGFDFPLFFLFLKNSSAVNVDSTDGGKDEGGSQPWEKSASSGKLNLNA